MPVVRIDVSNSARPASHHQAVATSAVCVVTNAAQKLAVGQRARGVLVEAQRAPQKQGLLGHDGCARAQLPQRQRPRVLAPPPH